MYKENPRLYFLLTMLFAGAFSFAQAQQAVRLHENLVEHIFHNQQIQILEDATTKLTFSEVLKRKEQFVTNTKHYPKNPDKNSAYWFRIKIDGKHQSGKYLLEFYDQTTEDIIAYLPDSSGKYIRSEAGALFNFHDRLFQHKNFEFMLPALSDGVHYCYFRVRSSRDINVIIVLRTVQRFVQYGLAEYFSFGLFYGMILVFSLHNLLMFIAVKRRQYLFYVFYILSIGMYEMASDGIGFQYLWPNYPILNTYAYGIALYFMSVFALIFTSELLHVRTKAPFLYRVIRHTIILRTIFFIFCLFFKPDWFIYKFIEFIPLTVAFVTGIWIWKNGYKPARFLVMGYIVLYIGFLTKVLTALGFGRYIPGYITYYSLSYCFVAEMVLLSFAIGDQVRLLKKRKDRAQRRIIEEMKVNASLKDNINKELEIKVKDRTLELEEKASVILQKSVIIEDQNIELIVKNQLLEDQKLEIFRMNKLLEKDNVELKTNIEKVIDARVLSSDMDFEEFSLKYPDKESCYKFLSKIKWESEFTCVKCSNMSYFNGHAPYSRRCTKCGYEESVLHQTIFENNKIPINKAFYLVYLMYTHKGLISSHKLSKKLALRQSTCWSYASRVNKIMVERKKMLSGSGKSGWSKLVLIEK